MDGSHYPSGLSTLPAKINGGNGRYAGAVLDVVRKTAVMRIGFADGTTETSTSIVLPALALVQDVFVYVHTAEATGATKTVDVGPLSSETGGDADGYLDGLDVSATGLIQAGATVTVGSNNTYLSVTTYGVLLEDFVAGEDTAAGGDGMVHKKAHANANGNTISWTPGSADFAELDAEIYVVYDEIITS